MKLNALAALLSLSVCHAIACGADPQPQAAATFTVNAIGYVRQTDGRTTIELDKKYEPGLLGVENISHIFVLWWFDRNDTPQKRSILQLHPQGDTTKPATGVFATRSPVRPNLIGLTHCKVVSVKGNVIEVESIDAFPGTPVLDIKRGGPDDRTEQPGNKRDAAPAKTPAK